MIQERIGNLVDIFNYAYGTCMLFDYVAVTDSHVAAWYKYHVRITVQTL